MNNKNGLINFKDPGGYKAALLAVACLEGHGNVSKVIIASIKKNKLFQQELKKISEKSSK